ncbi:MAG: polysaccharide biosynthesis/export family protein [Phycisphaerae bacterium]|nr:polysaccharide biosynthesis/export family protein [Phycisphaerae bacterium]
MKKTSIIQISLLLSIIFICNGCFSSKAKNIQAFLKPYQVDTSVETYIMNPPDVINVQCSRVAELHNQSQPIRPDGVISFEGIGEIKVAGLTTAAVTKILTEKIAGLYTLTGNEPIDVKVSVVRSNVYYVIGEVGRPGSRPITGRDTLFQAIADANPEVTAWEKRIQVIKPSETKDVEPKVFEISYKKMKKHGDLSKNVLLQPGDIVYVPPTPLAAFSQVLAELVRPIGLALSPARQVQQVSTGGL